MPAIVEKDKDYDVKKDDTLEEIVKKECPEVDWKMVARYNWGTDDTREVLRALSETVGVKVADLVKLSSHTNPEKLKLAPDSDLSPKIKLPKVWRKENLALEKTHTIKVKRHTPANAVSIAELDKWFIPEQEECRFAYQLEGEGEFADKVQVDVYGSKYCECTDWNDGYGMFGTDLADEPIFTKELNDQADERESYGLPGEGDKKGWYGDVSTDKGMLGRKTGTETKRYVNVAFSPYTVQCRYWKADGDKRARLKLEPFWPQFEATPTTPAATPAVGGNITLSWTNAAKADRGVLRIKDKNGQLVYMVEITGDKLKSGAQTIDWDKNYRPDAINSKFTREYFDDSAATDPDTAAAANENAPYVYEITTSVLKPKDESMKIKWNIKNTGGKLERGLLLITDGKDRLVFQKPLTKAKIADGDQEFVWDGKYSPEIKNSKGKEGEDNEGDDKAIPEDLPYRVEIQAHKGIDQLEGLALAAMHTEVRLYVHPKNVVPKELLYDAWNAKQSITLTPATYIPGDPPADTAGTLWYQYKLAEYGFHPGPVTGSTNDFYKVAIKEFKRSVPKHKTGATYERMTVDESENDETKNAITNIEGKYKRKPYGDLTKVLGNNDDPDMTEDEVKDAIGDPSKDIVVWADDRQYYTAGGAKDENNAEALSGNIGLGNYRLAMDIADARVDKDKAAIARPWIPLRAALRLLSREKGLTDEVDKPADDDEGKKLMKSMSRSIGPLRVDWTFDELPPDVSTIDAGAYDHTTARTRKYVAWALNNQKATYNRKDTKRDAVYTNCPATQGGIRPGGLATYFSEAFGKLNMSLRPWKGTAVTDTESIATVIHDHIAAGQKDKTKQSDAARVNLFEPLIGTAGALFNPSQIAGDGYRVRAEVQFKKFSGYDFPNLTTLEARYPTPPQSHTARMRIWRRSSVRGYMCWAAAGTGHWPGLLAGHRAHYRGAHVYFVHEGGTAPTTFAITDVFDPAQVPHQTRFKNTIKNNVSDVALQDTAKMELRAADIWPWGHKQEMGPNWWQSPVNLTSDKLYDNWLSPRIISPTWRKFRDGLLLALVKRIEELGYFRGHVFVEFAASPAIRMVKYVCNKAVGPHTYWYVKKVGTANKPDGPCPAPGCGAPAGNILATTGLGITYNDGLPLPAVGIALGATWLFTTSDADTWAHEIGHHRHLEHAASAPGAQYAARDVTDPAPNSELHDSQDNATQNWTTFGVTDVTDPGTTDASEKDWDRNCIMSYSASNYPAGRRGRDYFCGKCLLRNKGWRVQGIGYPGTKTKEPV